MRTAIPRTIFTFGLIFWTLMAFASTTKQAPCIKTAEGCWYCYWHIQRPTVKTWMIGENPKANPYLLAAVAEENKQLDKEIVITSRALAGEKSARQGAGW